MSLGPRRFAVVLAPLLALFACADLPDIPRGTCGNGVLDPGEDCDGAVDGRTCGVAGGVGACRFVCTAVTTATDASSTPSTCPETFGCGIDGVCRRSAGTFTLASKDARAGVDVIALGDFGKQGVKSAYAQSVNAIGLGAPRIFQFEENGTPLEPGSLPALLGPPQIADLDGDGYADATTIASEGLTVLRGVSPTTLTAVAFDAYRAPPGADARIGLVTMGPFVTEGTLIATFANIGPNGGPGTALLARDTVRAPRPLAYVPVDVGNLGEHAASVVDPRPNAVCGLPVYVAKKAKAIVTINACELDGSWAQPALGSFEAPRVLATTRYPIEQGTWALRVNNDAFDDLLVFTAGFWEVAFGDGKGGFASRPPGDPKAEAGRTAVFRPSLVEEPEPGPDGVIPPLPEEDAIAAFLREDITAALDIASAPKVVDELGNRANVLVAVGKRTIASTAFEAAVETPGGGADYRLPVAVAVARTETWTVARVGDVTGDGYLDVVGGSATNLDLDLASGTETVLFNLSRIETGAPTRAMVLGDFDGDRINDIAFAAPQTEADDLVIAYGQALSPPRSLVVVGSYPFISQIEAANLPSAGTIPADDLIEDLGLVTRTNRDGTGQPTVAILRGSGNRLPLASLGLTKVVSDEPGKPPKSFEGGAFAVSAVRAAGGGVRIDALAEDINATSGPDSDLSDVRVWTLSGLTSSDLVRGADVVPGCRTPFVKAASAPIDVNADGVQESAFLTFCDDKPALIVVSNAGADATTATFTGPSPIVLPDTPAAVIPVALVAGDVDGDGATDLVGTVSRFVGDGVKDGLEAIVERNRPVSFVLYNRGGVIDAANPVVLTPRPGEDIPVQAAAFLDVGGKRQLVVATPTTLLLVTGGPALSYAPFPLPNGARLERIRAMAAGDVTGDGVEDLVIGQQPSSLRVIVGGAR